MTARLRSRAAALLLAALAASCTEGEGAAAAGTPAPPSAPPAPEVPDEAPLVAFLGDSISAGLHLPERDAFPAVLQRRLAEAGLAFRLVNAGVSGDTTAGGLSRLDWLLRQEPSVVVVELGANDGLRGVDVAAVEENLRAIVRRARRGGARVLLLGMRLPPSYGARYTRAFEEVQARVARELDVPFVPYFMEGVAGDPELNLRDGIHPTAEGHRRLAAKVEPALAELLREIAEPRPASVR